MLFAMATFAIFTQLETPNMVAEVGAYGEANLGEIVEIAKDCRIVEPSVGQRFRDLRVCHRLRGLAQRPVDRNACTGAPKSKGAEECFESLSVDWLSHHLSN